MKNIIVYLNYLRAIPAIIAYLFVADKMFVNQDIKRNLGDKYRDRKKGNVFNLVWLLTYTKPFRNIYYYRVKKRSKLWGSFLNAFFPQQHDCEISGDIGPGLVIWHGYGTVISCHKIGCNFSVWQGVTIGRNPKEGGNLISQPSEITVLFIAMQL